MDLRREQRQQRASVRLESPKHAEHAEHTSANRDSPEERQQGDGAVRIAAGVAGTGRRSR